MRRGFLSKPNRRIGTSRATRTDKPTEPHKFVNDDTISSGQLLVNLEDNTVHGSNTTPLSQQKSLSGPISSVLDYLKSTTDEPKGILITRIPYYPLNEPITIALLYSGTQEALYSSPTFLKSPFKSPPPLSLDWPFVIKDIPGMGKGVFAREDIPLGKLILQERPFLITPRVTLASDKSAENLNRVSEILVEQLDDEARMAFYRLHNYKDASYSRIQGIIHTNMLGIGQLPGPFSGDHGCLGHAICRLNHSCSPNSIWKFDLDTLSVCISACQTIKKSEQIFVSYISAFGPRPERQLHLLENYSFTCTCTSCSLPMSESALSDVRRSLLFTASKQPLKEAMWPSSSFDHVMNHSLRILEMLDKEKLTGILPVFAAFHIFRLCLAYCASEDRAGAVKWAKRRLELAEAGLVMGDESEVRTWRNLVSMPEGSEFWGSRLRN